jgi:hypothetical protein
MKKDCYWFVDKTNPEEQTIQAMCLDCHRTNQLGWFWNGERQGYGDYDLFCSICNKPIYIRRESSNDQTNPENKKE